MAKFRYTVTVRGTETYEFNAETAEEQLEMIRKIMYDSEWQKENLVSNTIEREIEKVEEYKNGKYSIYIDRETI
ncbi:MAG: hypothetical protein IKD78_00005 [Bacteroidales bacterium]|nr:hypothetical protein [Bacteroidales bacterium]